MNKTLKTTSAIIGAGAMAFLLAACGAGDNQAGNSGASSADAAADEPAGPAAPDGAAATASASRGDARINPENWPSYPLIFERDAEQEQKIADLLAKMTLEEKVGQVIQGDIGSLTPDDVRKYNLGSVLNGGNSAPKGDVRIPAEEWLKLADEFWDASTDTSDGGVGIPTLWGTDAVHGHNNIVGATVFPHNIGLGAANDPALMREIGEVTAEEMLATGLDWTFAPTIAVVRDDRWGRTYEGYSEAPELVASYAGELVKGIQGDVETEDFLSEDRMIATVKHFVGDGGTVGGKDQGDNQSTEEQLRDIQAAGYPVAIQNGVQSVMASYNSFHGRKMHGYEPMLTGVLRGRFNFDGFVVGDWNGHGQVEGCTNVSCANAFNAGLDMFMAPDSWRELYDNTLAQVKSGEISQERLNEAVTRILRVKMRAGLFEAGKPSSRKRAGDWGILADPEHKALARRAVRESLVLLKNNDSALPLSPTSRVLVTGDGADNIGKQSGGWTLSWQGTGNANSDFPNGQSIYGGIRDAVEAAGGAAVLSADGAYDEKPDVAIVVFGENPYAEFQGDRPHLDYPLNDGLDLLKKYQDEGIKTISVFLTGRPLFVNPELNASDAFVVAWLPGDQGGGVADVLFTDADGNAPYDFTGRLSFSWPRTALQTPLNVGDENYDPLFAYGYGLSYDSEAANLAALPEDSGLTDGAADTLSRFIVAGDAAGIWRMIADDEKGQTQITDVEAISASGGFMARSQDYQAQEDTRVLTWTAPTLFAISGNPIDLSRQSNGDMAIAVTYAVLGDGPVGPTSIGIGCGEGCEGALDVTDGLQAAQGQGWRTSKLKLSCFADAGTDMTTIDMPFFIRSEGPLILQISTVEVDTNQGDSSCSL